MKRILSSSLKLILSISIGAFLIWYFLRDLSKEKNITPGDDYKNVSSLNISHWLIEDSSLVHYDDTLCILSADGKEKVFKSPYEGIIRIKKSEGENISIDDVFATSKLNELKVIKDAFSRVNYFWILVGLICGILAHMSRAYRWGLLIEVLGSKPKFSNLFGAVMVGYFANLAFPRIGEITKCGVLKRYDKIPMTELVGTMVIERFVDVLSLLVVFAIAILSQMDLLSEFFSKTVYDPMKNKLGESGNSVMLWIVLASFVLLFIVGLIVFKHSNHKLILRMKELMRNLFSGMKTILKLKRPWAFIFHSIFIWTMYFMMIYLCYNCLPETKNLSVMSGLSVLAFASLGMIAVQGGMGAYPVLVMLTLFEYGLAQHIGYAFGWVIWTAQTLLIILLGVVSIVVLPMINKTSQEKFNP